MTPIRPLLIRRLPNLNDAPFSWWIPVEKILMFGDAPYFLSWWLFFGVTVSTCVSTCTRNFTMPKSLYESHPNRWSYMLFDGIISWRLPSTSFIYCAQFWGTHRKVKFYVVLFSVFVARVDRCFSNAAECWNIQNARGTRANLNRSNSTIKLKAQNSLAFFSFSVVVWNPVLVFTCFTLLFFPAVLPIAREVYSRCRSASGGTRWAQLLLLILLHQQMWVDLSSHLVFRP